MNILRQQTNSDPIDFGRVAVLMGGTSTEREISLLSGHAIFKGLIEKGVDAVKIDTQRNLYYQLKDKNIDRAFIALHGRDGEDGVIQGFLETLNIPYTGSDVASSAIAMNKLISKRIWLQMGLKTAKFRTVGKLEKITPAIADSIVEELGNILFVKPVREGSSVGMSKVSNVKELIRAVMKAQEYDAVLVEEYIGGKEYTVSLLREQALPSINMQTPNEFYDYDAKYFSQSTQYSCPSGLESDVEKELQNTAVKAFAGLGCSGWGRVDFIRDKESGAFMLLEANTVPGMTESSLVPKSAKQAGFSFSDLVMEILSTSNTEKSNSTADVHLTTSESKGKHHG